MSDTEATPGPVDIDAPSAAAEFEPILDEPDAPDDYDGPRDIDADASRKRHGEAAKSHGKVHADEAAFQASMADPGAVHRIIVAEIGARPAGDTAAWDARAREITAVMDAAVAKSVERQDEADAGMIELARERQDPVRRKYKDFDAVMASAEISPSNPDVIRAILSHPKSADLCYLLAREPEAVHALNGMHPAEAAYALGKVAANLVKSPAPEARPARVRADPESMSMAQYAAWRKKGGGS